MFVIPYAMPNLPSIIEKSENPRKHCKVTSIICGMATNTFKHLFVIFRYYLDMLIDFVFSLYWDGKRQAIPDLERNFYMLTDSATTLALKIKQKQLKSEELVAACIQRIKTVNPVINAVTDERYEEALNEARAVDAQIEAGFTDEQFASKPFLGVPFTAKESHQVQGLLNTLGIRCRSHVRATEDAECVRLLREAGAIPIAVTNVPEINKWQESRNMVFGQTNNPYHTGRTAGGSSGGEAALSASFGAPISLCSDIGGSTRMPAFYCGLFGHNPTPGTTSFKGSTLRTGKDDTMASIGFVCKRAEDMGPLTAVVAADKAHLLNLNRIVDVKNVKFFYVESCRDLRVSSISDDLKKAMKKVIATVSAVSGDAPQPYYHPGFDHMYSLWRHCMTRESDVFARQITNNAGEANGPLELVKKMLGLSPYTLAGVVKLLDDQVLPRVNSEWADRTLAELKEDIVATLGDSGVLLFPSGPQPAPYHYSCFLRPFNFAYWAVLNALRLPATQVPLGLNEQGLPVGVQVAAGPNHDALCLAVARHLETEIGGFVAPCKVHEMTHEASLSDIDDIDDLVCTQVSTPTVIKTKDTGYLSMSSREAPSKSASDTVKPQTRAAKIQPSQPSGARSPEAPFKRAKPPHATPHREDAITREDILSIKKNQDDILSAIREMDAKFVALQDSITRDMATLRSQLATNSHRIEAFQVAKRDNLLGQLSHRPSAPPLEATPHYVESPAPQPTSDLGKAVQEHFDRLGAELAAEESKAGPQPGSSTR